MCSRFALFSRNAQFQSMPLFIAKSEETWIPPYPARQPAYADDDDDDDDVPLYPRQHERPLAERVHRGVSEGVWLGGRPSSARPASVRRGTSPATTTTRNTRTKKKKHHRDDNGTEAGGKGGDGERWYAVIGGKPGENIGGAVVSSWASVERAMSAIGTKEKREVQALGLPSHRAFRSKQAALNWLAVQGLNARGE